MGKQEGGERGGAVPSMWISAHDRSVWSRSASEWIPWAEARGKEKRRAAATAEMLRSLDSIVSDWPAGRLGGYN